MNGSIAFLLLIIVCLGASFYFIYNKFKKIENENLKNVAQLHKYEAKYSRIIDVDKEVEESLKRKSQLINDIQALQLDYQKNMVFFRF